MCLSSPTVYPLTCLSPDSHPAMAVLPLTLCPSALNLPHFPGTERLRRNAMSAINGHDFIDQVQPAPSKSWSRMSPGQQLTHPGQAAQAQPGTAASSTELLSMCSAGKFVLLPPAEAPDTHLPLNISRPDRLLINLELPRQDWSGSSRSAVPAVQQQLQEPERLNL